MKKFIRYKEHKRIIAERETYWQERIKLLTAVHDSEKKRLREEHERKLKTSRELQTYMREVQERVNATPSGKWVRKLGPHELGEKVVFHNETQSTEAD